MITATLNGNPMPTIQRQFLRTPIDVAVDVVPLSNDMYTDFFPNRRSLWTFNYESLTKAEYDALKAVYDSQFTANDYPTLVIPFYGVNIVARMTINEQDIWNNCGDVQGVQITFRETAQLA